MSYLICSLVSFSIGVALTYWAMKIEKDVGKFCEYQE